MGVQDYFGFLDIIFFSLGCKNIPDTKPISPFAPASLNVNAFSNSEIDFCWTDNSTSEDGFKIERKTTSNGWTFFNGKIDDLRINNRALTNAEIQHLSKNKTTKP